MKTKFIAEICSNHNGKLSRCLKFVDEAKRLNCFAVKFQLFKIDQLFAPEFIKKNKILKKRKKYELPKHFIPIIARYCKKKKIKYSCTPFHLDAVDQLKDYVDFFKIASYEILWKELLVKCAKTKKPIVMSTGMATMSEVKKAYQILKKNGCKKIIILHCVSSYPAKIESCNLNSITYLRKKFRCEVGWSDHTVNPFVIYSAAVEKKADFIEFHLDLDGKGWEYNDAEHCWLPNQIVNLIKFLNNRNKILGKEVKVFSKSEVNERSYRSDPKDGLRPFIKLR